MNELIETVNTVAGRWAAGMWPILWQSTVLTGIVFVLCRMLRRAPAALRYWLWMFVALRLVAMPFITVSLPLLPARAGPEPMGAILPPEPAIVPVADEAVIPAERPPTVPKNAIAPAAHPEAHRAQPVFPSVWAWLMAVWVAGVAFLSLRFAYGWRRMQHLVAGARELTDPDLLRIAEESARKLGLRKLPRVVLTESAHPPCVFGVFHPAVILPRALASNASPEELWAFLAHEFTHLRRRDPLLGWVVALCEIFYFFHPIVYLVSRQLTLERERACDDRVLADGETDRDVYARVLLSAVEITRASRVQISPAVVPLETFRSLKIRLTEVASGLMRPARLTRTMAAFLVVIAFLAVPGIILTARSLQGVAADQSSLVTTVHGPNTIDPEARKLYEINRSRLSWSSLKVAYVLEMETTPEFFRQNEEDHAYLKELTETEGFEKLPDILRKGLEEELAQGPGDFGPPKKRLVQSFARQGDNVQITTTETLKDGQEFITIWSYNGETLKTVFPTQRRAELRKYNGWFGWAVPPYAGYATEDNGYQIIANSLDEPFLSEPTGLELLPLTEEEERAGVVRYRMVHIADANIWRMDARNHSITDVTVDPGRGNVILSMKVSRETHYPNGVVTDPLPIRDLRVTKVENVNGVFYPVAYELTRSGPKSQEPSLTDAILGLLDPDKAVELESRQMTEPVVVAFEKFEASEVRINQPLEKKDVDLPFEDGMTITDTTQDPFVTYTYHEDSAEPGSEATEEFAKAGPEETLSPAAAGAGATGLSSEQANKEAGTQTITLEEAVRNLEARMRLLRSKKLQFDYTRTRNYDDGRPSVTENCVLMAFGGAYVEDSRPSPGASEATIRYFTARLSKTQDRRLETLTDDEGVRVEVWDHGKRMRYLSSSQVRGVDSALPKQWTTVAASEWLREKAAFKQDVVWNGQRCVEITLEGTPLYYAPDLEWAYLGHERSGKDRTVFSGFKRIRGLLLPTKIEIVTPNETEVYSIRHVAVDADFAPEVFILPIPQEGTVVTLDEPLWNADDPGASQVERRITWTDPLSPDDQRLLIVARSRWRFSDYYKAKTSRYPLPFFDRERNQIIWAKHDEDVGWIKVHEGDQLPERFGAAPWDDLPAPLGPGAGGDRSPGPETTGAAGESVPKITYGGIVKDASGNPIQGVNVAAYTDYYGRAEPWPEQFPATDGDGRFTIGPVKKMDSEEGYYTFIFSHPDYALGFERTLWLEDEDSEFDPLDISITLLGPTTSEGIVTNEKGGPVAGATVTAEIQVFTEAFSGYMFFDERYDLATHTDPQGRFVIPKVPQGGRLHIKVQHGDYVSFSTRRGYRNDRFPIRAGDRNVAIALERAGSIEGRILTHGKPLEMKDIYVSAEDPTKGSWGSALSDETGRFSIAGLREGTYRIMPSGKRLAEQGLVGVLLDGIELGKGEKVDSVSVEVTEGQTVQGRLVFEDSGEPAAEQSVDVEARDPAGLRVFSTSSDSDGTFTLIVRPGDYDVLTRGWKEGQYQKLATPLHVEPGQDIHGFDISIPTRRVVQGRLIDRDGQGLRGRVHLALRGSWEDTKPDGTFAVPEPSGDPWNFYIGFALSADEKTGRGFVWKTEDRGKNVELILEPLAKLSGRIVDASGAPLSSTELTLYVGPFQRYIYCPIGRPPWTISQNDDGTFSIETVPVGVPLALYASKPGAQTQVDLPETKPGEELRVGDVVLKRDIETPADAWTDKIAGRVIDEKGEPVAGCWVNMYVAPELREDATDRKGRFVLEPMPPGITGTLKVSAPGYGFSDFPDIASGSEDLELQIFPVGWHLYGKEAPELTIEKWINSEPISLTSLRGKVVLLDIGMHIVRYADYLEPVQEAYRKYGDRGLVVIGIHRKEPIVTEDQISEFLDEHNIAFPVALDSGETYTTYGVKSSPTRILIDKEGKVRRSLPWDQLNKPITELLAE